MPTYHSADEIDKNSSGHDVKIATDDAHHDNHHKFQRGHREPGQLELGATEILEGRSGFQREVVSSSGLANSSIRHHWEARFKSDFVSALVAEVIGVWFYVFAGQASTATYVLTAVAGSQQGNLTMIGFAYALGIMFAITVCAPTSGGHFHPAMTIAQVIFKGFPIRKAPFYIVAQLFGAFLASMMVYASWRTEMLAYTAELTAAGKTAAIFTPSGPAGILAIFPSPGRNLGEIFANEFFGDVLIAMVIWSQLDAQNVFTSPAMAPYTIGLAFGVIVWGFSSGTIVTNTARDLGARFACGAIWGRECFPTKYSAIAALTNIPASLLGISIYTFFLSDSRRPLAHHALTGLMQEEEAHRDLSTQRHNEILEKQITRTMSRGGDASALMAKRTRVAKSNE